MKKCKICVPIAGKTEEEILAEARLLRAHTYFSAVSFAEFRFDLWQEAEAARLPQLLETLRRTVEPCGLIFTIRTEIQGGAFPYHAKDYEALNRIAIESGHIRMADVELLREGCGQGFPSEGDRESADRLRQAAREKQVRIISSHHDFAKTPPMEELLVFFSMMRDTGAEILKLACMPQREEDVFALMRANRAFREIDREAHEYISMSMGSLGRASRLLVSLSGSDYSFAAAGAASAPGQLALEDMVQGLALLENAH